MNKLKMIKHAIDVAKEESYYPEKKRKCLDKRIRENLKWVRKYKEYNRFYNLYGLDTKDAKDIFNMGYIDYDMSFRIPREKANRLGDPNAQLYLLRDKYQFWKYLSSYGISTPTVFAFIKNGVIYDSKLVKKDIEWLKQFNDYFIKDNNGECGSFVKHIKSGADLDSSLEVFTNKNGEYICQEKVIQGKQLSELNPHAINTIRIITTKKKDGTIDVLAALLRVGTSKTGDVDNWAKGGLAVGINDDGSLTKYGFYKPHLGVGLKADTHPDTGIIFADFKIEHYDEIKEFVKRAHACFYGIHSIGWDLAISEKGPTLIEGNDNWEISLMQAHQPLKDKWLDSLK